MVAAKKKTNTKRVIFQVTMRVPAHPARQHGAGCSNCVPSCPHLRPQALVRRAKLSHDSAVSGRVPTGPDAPMPPAPRGPAIGSCRNSEFFYSRRRTIKASPNLPPGLYHCFLEIFPMQFAKNSLFACPCGDRTLSVGLGPTGVKPLRPAGKNHLSFDISLLTKLF